VPAVDKPATGVSVWKHQADVAVLKFVTKFVLQHAYPSL
jgi:hypothetical protein